MLVVIPCRQVFAIHLNAFQKQVLFFILYMILSAVLFNFFVFSLLLILSNLVGLLAFKITSYFLVSCHTIFFAKACQLYYHFCYQLPNQIVLVGEHYRRDLLTSQQEQQVLQHFRSKISDQSSCSINSKVATPPNNSNQKNSISLHFRTQHLSTFTGRRAISDVFVLLSQGAF